MEETASPVETGEEYRWRMGMLSKLAVITVTGPEMAAIMMTKLVLFLAICYRLLKDESSVVRRLGGPLVIGVMVLCVKVYS